MKYTVIVRTEEGVILGSFEVELSKPARGHPPGGPPDPGRHAVNEVEIGQVVRGYGPSAN